MPESTHDQASRSSSSSHHGTGTQSPRDTPSTETTTLLPQQPIRPPTSDEKDRDVHYRGPITGPRFKFLLFSVLFGSTIAFFDSTLMASAHPVITSYFHASNAASWFSTVFFLTSTVFQPLYGRLSDTIGRRSVYLFSIFMFFVSTAWCGAAPNLGSFIAARAICGLGAGGVMSMASILISDVVKIEYRGIYQSWFNLAYGTGTGLGAALGGWLCDRFGWRMAFYLQLPFILLFGVLAAIACPPGLGPNLAKTSGKGLRETFSSFDTYGAMGLTATTTCLILGVNLGGNVFTWSHPLVITSLVLFVVAAVSLYFIERKAKYPILPIPLLSTNPNASLMWSNFFGAIVVNTALFNIPLYLQAVRQTTPTTSGLFLLAPLTGISITAMSVGYYITRTRNMKAPMTIGTFVLLFGTIVLSTCLSAEVPTWVIPFLIPFCSIGQGFFFPPVTIALLAINPQDDQAVVGTTLGLVRSLGAILGVAVSSWVLQNSLLLFLQEYVTSADPAKKAWIIKMARESVSSIRDLDPKHKGQVIAAYAASLRATFLMSVIVGVICVILIWPLKVPRLQSQTDKDNTETPGGGRGGDDEDEAGRDSILGPPLGILDARDQVPVEYEIEPDLLEAVDEEGQEQQQPWQHRELSGDRAVSGGDDEHHVGSIPRAEGGALRHKRSRRASFDTQWR